MAASAPALYAGGAESREIYESSEPGCWRAWGGDFPGRGAAWLRAGISAEGGMAVRSRQRPSEYLWTFQLGSLGLRKLRTF